MINICYLEEFLINYVEHIEDYKALIYLLSLLPNLYQYKFLLNLLKYEDVLEDGDLLEGIIPIGIIKITKEHIILEHDDEIDILLELPEEWEI